MEGMFVMVEGYEETSERVVVWSHHVSPSMHKT
jgi:hypothetical protein